MLRSIGRTHRIFDASTVVALLACLGLLFQGVLRLTHHHDGAAYRIAHTKAETGDHGQNGHHGHHGHDEADCAICQALAATASAAPPFELASFAAPDGIGQRAEISTQTIPDTSRSAHWRSRAPPAA